MNWIGFWAGSSCHSARIEVHTASVCAILQHHQSSFIYWTSGLERFMCTQFNKLQKTFLLFVVYRGIKIISELNGTSSFNRKPNILKWQREQKALPLTWAGCGLKKLFHYMVYCTYSQLWQRSRWVWDFMVAPCCIVVSLVVANRRRMGVNTRRLRQPSRRPHLYLTPIILVINI